MKAAFDMKAAILSFHLTPTDKIAESKTSSMDYCALFKILPEESESHWLPEILQVALYYVRFQQE